MKIPRFSLQELFVVTTLVAFSTAILSNPTASLVLCIFLAAGVLQVFLFGIIRGLEGGKRSRAVTLIVLAILFGLFGFCLFLPAV